MHRARQETKDDQQKQETKLKREMCMKVRERGMPTPART